MPTRAQKVIGIQRIKVWWLYKQRFLGNYAFVHVPKCGGTSIEAALGVPWKIHKTAQEQRRIFGRRAWERVFSFAVVRNPFARVLSDYTYRSTEVPFYRARPLRGIAFNDWVRLTYQERDPQFFDRPLFLAPAMEWVADEEDHILVDYVAKLETIGTDWPVIRANIRRCGPLPHLNRSATPDYREVYSSEARRIVERHFEADLEAFKYSF